MVKAVALSFNKIDALRFTLAAAATVALMDGQAEVIVTAHSDLLKDMDLHDIGESARAFNELLKGHGRVTTPSGQQCCHIHGAFVRETSGVRCDGHGDAGVG
jgi:hypothetical protein